jgi:hypothetical protein
LVNYCKYLAGFCIGNYATKSRPTSDRLFVARG